MKTKLFPKCGNNSVYYILKEIKLLLRIRGNNLSEVDISQDELVPYSDNNLDKVGEILSIRNLRRAAWYFLDHGAATAWTLQKRLEISERTTYRYLKNLRTFDFVVLALKTSKPRGKKGGPRSEVWMVPDATIDQINEAQNLHRRLMSPKFVAGERLGQLILEEYLEPRRIDTITKKEALKIARDRGMRGNLSDIVIFAMDYLHEKGIKVIGIPKTMDNDVPGTDYCIGFSTCVTRTISLTHALRTTAGSHERFLVIEVFGRYAGFTALLPTMAGAANRCVIPEYKFNIEKLCELLTEDRETNPSRYSVVLVSEGATFKGGDMIFEGNDQDMFGHKKLGGIGDLVSSQLKKLSPKYNNGRQINMINQRLSYLVRCGDPDAIDSIVPMAYGNLAFDLVLSNTSARLVSLHNGCYDTVPIDVVTRQKKVVDVGKYYNTERLRPKYDTVMRQPLLIMTSDV